MELQTKLVHADDANHRVNDVVAPINVATTFKYSDDPAQLIPAKESSLNEGWVASGNPIYSRLSHPNSESVEAVISDILGHPAVVYNSGLGAFNALMFHVNPKQIFISEGYHGCHQIVELFKRVSGLKKYSLKPEDLAHVSKGDLIHVETPVNPEGTSFDIAAIAEIAHSKGAILSVDSTLAPYPLQDPFLFGADIVMHSATKYFGGHSDLLAGLLVVKTPQERHALHVDRIYLATNISNLDAYLLLRSLRTYELRIKQQSATATKLVAFLHDALQSGKYKALKSVSHSSLQTEPFVTKQLPNGFGPVFSIHVSSSEIAKQLPSKLRLFHHATSLGGVESLIEWRALSSANTPETLLRVSVGIENSDDLIKDFDQALSSFE